MRSAETIVKCLEAHGIERVYCVPGESYLALLDALYESSIEVIICRHESGAGFMAVAEARLTGKPAVFLVSRGPSATNGSIAVHVRRAGRDPRHSLHWPGFTLERTRGAFQEVDYGQFFGGMAKAVYEVHEASKMAEIVTRSFRLAAEGTPGPVIISLPEDVLSDDAGDHIPAPFPLPVAHHGAGDIATILAMIENAATPIVVAGALLRGSKGAAALEKFAEALRIPVAVTWKNQDIFDNASPLYAGHIGFGNPPRHRQALANADLIIAVGTRLGDVASLNYTFPAAPEPKQKVIHIYPDGECIGRVFRTDFGLVADPIGVLTDLAANPRVVSTAREQWRASINDFVRDFQVFASPEPNDAVDFGKVVVALAAQAPANAIITTDAGNMSTWVHRHWVMTPKNILLGAIAGAMGFGVPTAVAASILDKTRTVITFVGDGGILMTGQELATAVQYGARPRIVISDNGIYGTIRTHQEKHYPHRVSGTDLVNPDFTMWAKSFGVFTETIAIGDDIDAKVKAFLAHEGAAVLHVKSSKEALSAFTTLSALN